jgi:hypothetical protein
LQDLNSAKHHHQLFLKSVMMVSPGIIDNAVIPLDHRSYFTRQGIDKFEIFQ